MSQARSELFAFIGAALATTIGIFVAQQLYFSYIDQAYHADLKLNAANKAIVDMRQAEADKLASGKIPLDRAKALLAERGRGGFGSVAPVQSSDLSPISGWIRLHSFKPAIAHPIRTARVAEPIAVPAVVEPAPEVVPAPAPQSPATPTPKQKKLAGKPTGKTK
jgi:hypothetical protein